MALPTLVALSNLKQQVQATNATVNIGNVVTDVLTSVATESAKVKVIEAFVNQLQSLDGILAVETNATFIADVATSLGITTTQVLAIVTNALEIQAANYGVTRNPAQAASGIVLFGRATALTGSDVTIPTGTAVSTTSGINYTTTATVVMVVANAASYYNPTLNLYVLEAPTQATITGTAGNTVENTIINENNIIANLPLVTNPVAFTNGFNRQTDAELVNSIKAKIAGNNIGADGGYDKLVLSTGLVSDVTTVGAGNPLMVRDRNFGGDVDVYLLEQQLISVTDNKVQGAVTPDAQYIMADQPVDSVLAVTGTFSSTPGYTFATPGDYTFQKDTNLFTSNSARSQDKIVWQFGGNKPDLNTTYYVNYLTDNNILQINTLLQNPDNHILGVDVLVRQGIKVPVDFNFSIVLTSGALRTTVAPAVTAALLTYVDTLGFGTALSQAALIAIVEDTPGVSRVILPVNKFNLTSAGGGQLDEITAVQNQYIRLENIIIT